MEDDPYDSESESEDDDADSSVGHEMKLMENIFGTAFLQQIQGMDDSVGMDQIGKVMGNMFNSQPEMLEDLQRQMEAVSNAMKDFSQHVTTENSVPVPKEDLSSLSDQWKPSVLLQRFLSLNGSYPLIGRHSTLLKDFFSGSGSLVWNLSETGTCLLTDAILYCMSLLKDENIWEPVKPVKIIMSGNIHLTDVGLYWLSVLLENDGDLREIVLDGCRQVTEKGLLYLTKGRRVPLRISVAASQVTYIPESLVNGNHRIVLNRCPLLQHISLGGEDDKKPLFQSLLVVCQLKSSPVSVTDLLTGEQSNFKEVQLEKWNFNTIELLADDPCFGILIPPDITQVILPFDVKSDPKQVLEELTGCVAHFLAQEVYVENERVPVRTDSGHTRQRWSASYSPGALVDHSTGIVWLFSSQTMAQPFCRKNSSFCICITDIQAEAHGVAIVIGFQSSDSERISHEKRVVAKKGDQVEMACNMVNTVTFLLNGNQLDSPMTGLTASDLADCYPFVRVEDKPSSVKYRIVNYNCIAPELYARCLEEKKHLFTYSSCKNVIMDEDSSTALFQISSESEANYLVVDLVSSIACEFSFRILGFEEGQPPAVAFGIMCAPTNVDDIRTTVNDAVLFGLAEGTGVLMSDGHNYRTYTSGYDVNENDVMSVKVAGFTHDVILPGDTVHIYFFKNGNQVGDIEWTFSGKNIKKNGLPPSFIMLVEKHSVKAELLNYAKPSNQANQMYAFTNDQFLLAGRMHQITMTQNRIIAEDSVSAETSQIGCYISANSLTAHNHHFEVLLSRLDRSKLTGIGVAHKRYDLFEMPGWYSGSVAWHFDNSRVYLEDSSGVHYDGCDVDVKEGDIVGCGFEPTDNFDALSGMPCAHQKLMMYFTVNGKKVFSVPFNYKGGGLNPAIGFARAGNTAVLLNHFYQNDDNVSKVVNDDTNQKDGTEATAEMRTDGGAVNFMLLAVGSVSGLKLKADELRDNLAKYSLLLSTKINNIRERCAERASFSEHQQLASFGKLKLNVDRFVNSFSKRCFLVAARSDSPQEKKKVEETIVKIQDSVWKSRPYLYSYFPTHASVLEILMRCKLTHKVLTVDQLCSTHVEVAGVDRTVLDRLLCVLNSWGKIIYLRSDEKSLIVMDIQWFTNLLHAVNSQCKEKSGDCRMSFLNNSTVIWRDKFLLKMAMKFLNDESLMYALLEALVEHGLLLRLKPPREFKGDVKACFICPQSLLTPPLSIATMKERYFGDEHVHANSYVLKQEAKVFDQMGACIFYDLLSVCCRMFKPILLWSSGIVWHQGLVEVALWADNHSSLSFRLFTKVMVVCPVLKEREREEKFDVKPFADAAMSVLMLVNDLCHVVFMKHGVVYETTNNITRQPQGSALVSASHTWDMPLLRSTLRPISTCTLCGSCCDKGMGCDFNEIPLDDYSRCQCHTTSTACWDCGMCKKCAVRLMNFNIQLRPCNYGLHQWASDEVGTLSKRELNPSSWNELQLICVKDVPSRKQMPVISLVSVQQKLVIMAFPGRPMLFEESSEHILRRKMIPGLESELLRQGDVITVKIKEPLIKCSTSSTSDISEWITDEKPRYHFSQQYYMKVLQRTGHCYYVAPASKPVGLLTAELPFSRECSYFEFEIVDTGEIGAIAIGAVPKNYPRGHQPGWTTGAIGYHADDGGIFRESGFARIHLATCTVGDKMGCGVEFSDDRLVVYFTKNGRDNRIYETPWGSASTELYPAIGMHSFGESINLLDMQPWRSAKEQDPSTTQVDLTTMKAFKNKVMEIIPMSILTFPRESTTKKETKSSLYLFNKSDNQVLFKVKVSSNKLFKFKPRRGVISPNSKQPTEVSVTLDAGYLGVDDLTGERIMVQYIELPNSVEVIAEHFKSVWDDHKSSINSSYKISCAWDENTRGSKTGGKSEVAEPQLLPVLSEGSPNKGRCCLFFSTPDHGQFGIRMYATFLAAYCVEIKKNGVTVADFYVPRLKYNVRFEIENGGSMNYFHILCPKLPMEICQDVFEGLCVEAELDLSNAENGLLILKNKTLVEPVTAKYVFYAQCIVLKVKSNGRYVLGVPIDGQLANQSRWMKFDATANDIHPVGWCDKNFSEMAGEQVRIVDGNGKTTVITATVYNESNQKAVVLRCDCELITDQPDLSYIFDNAKLDTTPSGVIKYGVQCSQFAYLPTVQKALLAQQSEELKDWQSLADAFFSHICVFLPSNLDDEVLSYPFYGQLMDVKSLAAYSLCKDSRKAQLKYGGNVYQDIHFIDARGLSPTLTRFSTDLIFGDLVSARAYAELSTSKMKLPAHSNLLSVDSKKAMSKLQIENAMHHIVEFYALTCQLLATSLGSLMDLPCHEDRASLLEESVGKDKLNHADLMSGRCHAHRLCHGTDDDFKMELFHPYHELVTSLKYSVAGLKQLPSEMAACFRNLQLLELTGADKLECLFDDFYLLSQLRHFSLVGENTVSRITDSVGDCEMLNFLQLSRSHISELPNAISRSQSLMHIDVEFSLLKSLPVTFGNLTNLVYLNLSCNPLASLPTGLANLRNLKILKLSGTPWLESLPSSQLAEELNAIQNSKILSLSGDSVQSLDEIIAKASIPGRAESEVLANVNAELFLKVPRLGLVVDTTITKGGCGLPEEIFQLTSLEELELRYQGMIAIPPTISKLINLRTLNVDHCPLLESLPGSMGELPVLKTLNLRNCPSLRTPPNEVVARSTDAIMAYLKRLNCGFTKNWRTKLMLVGLGGAGKTSLLRALMSDTHTTEQLGAEDLTDGIAIDTWAVDHNGKQISYSTWDFAGQTVYYNTHQFFLSNRAVYLLLWTTRLGFEHAGLDFWLSSIKCHAPKSPVFVIGTHCDMVEKQEIPISSLMREYPQIKGFHFVSSIRGTGIAELKTAILEATLAEKYMGEKVPQVFLNLEKQVLSQRKNHALLSWEAVCKFGLDIGIYDEADIKRAVQFLHDLGTVQYFDTEFLRNHIVINPQWIVNVMACVVSVKDSPIKDGRFRHSDIDQVWKEYAEHTDFPDICKWLLRLTEEFDLTFPMPNEDVNIVPCLLPQSEPEFDWQQNVSGCKTLMMIYQFNYLPAGLFNRAQVRLFQFSNCNNIWKRGSLLEKNGNQAVLRQMSDRELQVKVRGQRPENLLFVIHEVIETLVAESFDGVSYEYLIPCPDCVDKNEQADYTEKSMFEASMIRSAKKLSATFIQCRQWFHTVPMIALESVMPPESSAEHDVHMLSSMQALSDLGNSMSTDIFISYNADESAEKAFCPKTVKQHLEKDGYSCWFKDALSSADMQDPTVIMALKSSKLLLVFLSTEYVQNEACYSFFEYARNVLAKSYIIVAVGSNFDWRTTNLGAQIGVEIYIDMVKYSMEAKLNELKERIKLKLSAVAQIVKDCFISYAWANSLTAVNAGTRRVNDALGWEGGDPRKLKAFLAEKGISCWIDCEQVGREKSGLLSDITTGLKYSKVVVACISKEYAKSDNCMMELTYTTITLKKPVVFVVVGNGNEWKDTEIGLVRARLKNAPKVNLQRQNDQGLSQLLKSVQDIIASQPSIVSQPDVSLKSSQADDIRMSFTEEFELAQRKFMRLISVFASNMSTVPYPRVFFVDFVIRKQQQTVLNPTTRQTSSSRDLRTSDVLKHRSSMLSAVGEDKTDDDWLAEEMCVKLICEHEQGWHCSSTVVMLKNIEQTEIKHLILASAPYLFRVYKLLSHSGIQLDCQLSHAGRAFLSFVETAALEKESQDVGVAYSHLRKHLITIDERRVMGKLQRCHYPTGQIRWLCEDHSKASHVTVLSSDVATLAHSQPLVTESDLLMKDIIKSRTKQHNIRDLDDVDGPSKSGSAKRSTSKLSSAAKAFSGSKLPPASIAREGARPTVVKQNMEKLKNAKDKLRLAALVARTANSWSNQPSAATSQACQIL